MKAKNMKQKSEPMPVIDNVKWMRGHYHCKKCSAEIECCAALPWNVWTGVRRVGVCDCGQILVEREYKEVKWLWQRA
jgi:hypothetical protein